MSAPHYVPHGLADRPRKGESLPAPAGWTADRPADLGGGQPEGPYLGSQGPDQGYALTLVHLFTPRLVLVDGEHLHDVEAGALVVALKRASVFGRAPVVHDLEVAFTVFGFLSSAPADLVAARRLLFDGVGHDYARRRHVADVVPEATLRLTPAAAAERHGQDWRSLLVA